MKGLDETPADIARRMRQLAAGVADPADAKAIKLYADWIEAHPEDDEVRELVARSQQEEPTPGE